MTTQKTIAVIQARMGSSRLPGKILQPIAGVAMLDWVVQRVRSAQQIHDVVVATTDSAKDDALVEYCRRQDWPCIRGSETDVLSRYGLAAEQFSADRIVRITSDCPFIDADIIDEVINQLDQQPGLNYSCNFFPQRWFPRGLDCECFDRNTLERVHEMAILPEEREHVTLAIYRNPERFAICGIAPEADYSEHRWTVDTDEDLCLVNKIAVAIGHRHFSWRAALAVVQANPDWSQINRHIMQKAA
jgi:spore coat polysaccharide biosynthesis protein SpsF